jgi:hypothetical protein
MLLDENPVAKNLDPTQAGGGHFESDPYEGSQISYDPPHARILYLCSLDQKGD